MTKKSELEDSFNEGFKAGRESMRQDIINRIDQLEIKPSLSNALGMKYMAKKAVEETK
jgi:hypothetical protein